MDSEQKGLDRSKRQYKDSLFPEYSQWSWISRHPIEYNLLPRFEATDIAIAGVHYWQEEIWCLFDLRVQAAWMTTVSCVKLRSFNKLIIFNPSANWLCLRTMMIYDPKVSPAACIWTGEVCSFWEGQEITDSCHHKLASSSRGNASETTQRKASVLGDLTPHWDCIEEPQELSYPNNIKQRMHNNTRHIVALPLN